MTSRWTIGTVADELLACEAERRDRPPFTDDWADLDVETGYRIQDLTLQRRLDRGERLIGVKLGLTSRAKQQRMGVDMPFVAWLTDAMLLPAGLPVPQDRLIHPRVEPEIVFVMRDRLEGPGVDVETAMAAVGSVHAGAEVIDSRYRDFRFKAGDVVADNASSGCYVTAPESLPPEDLDLVAEPVTVLVDGTEVDSATGAAVLGHPGEALALAANELARRILPDYGIEVTPVNMSRPQDVAAAFRPNTRLVHCESPCNPILRLTDLAAISELARQHGALMSVDSTLATPVATQPLSLGADLVIHWLTKFINGHGDALGGVVCGRKDLVEKIRSRAGVYP